jgi:glycosyltransferase involved in cell wall biosynthesis
MNNEANSQPQVLQVGFSTAWGGGAVVVLQLVEKLIQLGCQVTMLCSTEPLAAARFSQIGTEIIYARHYRRPISPVQDALLLYEVYSICRRRHFDVVHTHNPKSGVVGRIAAGLVGTPLVIHTIHGLPFNDAMPSWRAWLYRTMERIAARYCDVHISVNETDRRRAIEAGLGGPDRIVTVLNGIDVDQFINVTPAPLRTELSLPDDAILIGWTGRLNFLKGLEYLIKALPPLIAAEPRAHVLLVGSGELENDLRALVTELGVEDHCHFLGFRQDIPALLASLDLYAQPSLSEGLSISLLEAMAAGKPIVTTDITGNREVIEGGVSGLLVPPTDVEALATALLKLMRDPTRSQRLARQARQRVEQHFNADRMVKETVDLYRHWLARTAVGKTIPALEV